MVVGAEAGQVSRVLDGVWRIEFTRVVAIVARILGDLGKAEEVAQDAWVAALEQWPRDGVPDNPAAWLTTTARRRAIDLVRREQTLARKEGELGAELERSGDGTDDDVDGLLDALDPDQVDDDVLRLIFLTCHPVLSMPARVALTLRLVGGLSTDEIARAYLVPEPTVAQRIVRAKRTLARAGVRFELPAAHERAERLDAVMQSIYLIFNEGYAATSGEHWMRPELCDEAMRIGRVLASLVPDEPEVHGLVAMMEIQASRSRARVDGAGRPVLLLEQNRARWDWVLIARGLAGVERAEALGGEPGPYLLQAQIAACHARARTAEATDWPRIAGLYEQLAALTGSPVVELNRAVALGMAFGPESGLALVDELADDSALRDYHLLPAVRGDLLERAGRATDAAEAFDVAAALTRNEQERAVLTGRAARARRSATT